MIERGTPATARELCAGLDTDGWRTPLAEGEWTPLQVVGQLLDALEGPRAADLAMLEGVDDAGRERHGVHGEQGEVAGHDLAHLNQLARAVAAVG
jgi:hypothetical protein